MPALKTAEGFFFGKGSLTDMGERYPVLDEHHESNIRGLFVIGNLGGTPDIKAALNSGYDLGRYLLTRREKCKCPVDTEVAILGGGPAGVNCAIELKKEKVEHLILERRSLFSAIRAFEPDLFLYWAKTGDQRLRGTLPYKECTAGDLLKVWDPIAAEHNPSVRLGVEVTGLTKLCHFEIETKAGQKVKAHRVVAASGKVITLEKIGPTEIQGVDCRQAKGEISKEKIASTDLPWDFLRKIQLKRESQWNTQRALWACSSILAIGAIYFIGKTKPGLVPTTELAGVKLGFWEYYSLLYTAIVTGHGIKAARRWNDRLQWKKYLSLIFFQAVFFCALPVFILQDWRAYGLVYAWPLALKPHNWDQFAASSFYFWWTIGLSAVILPVFVLFQGKKYCSWVCGCGALAETMGDRWRHFSPKGPENVKRERALLWVTAAVLAGTVMAATHAPGRGAMNWAVAWVYDYALIAVVPIGLYPFLGGKVWCRYWCPTAWYMHMLSKLYTRWGISRFAIHSRKERCIACNMCSRYCEVGIDVKRFAVRGETLDNGNSSCIGCGICISVCPTDTLSFTEWSQPVQLDLAKAVS